MKKERFMQPAGSNKGIVDGNELAELERELEKMKHALAISQARERQALRQGFEAGQAIADDGNYKFHVAIRWTEAVRAYIRELERRCRLNLDPGAQVTNWDEVERLTARVKEFEERLARSYLGCQCAGLPPRLDREFSPDRFRLSCPNCGQKTEWHDHPRHAVLAWNALQNCEETR
jgi:hypothetical protein